MEVTDDFLENLNAGCFLAVFLENYDKMPVLGKIILGKHILKFITGKWSPQNIPRRKTKPWLEDLQKSCIVC